MNNPNTWKHLEKCIYWFTLYDKKLSKKVVTYALYHHLCSCSCINFTNLWCMLVIIERLMILKATVARTRKDIFIMVLFLQKWCLLLIFLNIFNESLFSGSPGSRPKLLLQFYGAGLNVLSGKSVLTSFTSLSKRFSC